MGTLVTDAGCFQSLQTSKKSQNTKQKLNIHHWQFCFHCKLCERAFSSEPLSYY